MKKILVVDDDRIISSFMHDLLTKQGHEVISASDGLSALDVLESYTPDIIFVDLVMPNIGGDKLCKVIRAMDRLREVRLVILSAVAAEQDADIEKLDVDACIAKGPLPKMAGHILSVIEQLEISRSSRLSQEVIGTQGMASRRIAEELLSVKRHFEMILERMSEGILEITHEGRIVYANPAALSLVGISEEKLLGSRLQELFDGNDRKRVEELLEGNGNEQNKTISDEPPLHLCGYLVVVRRLYLNGESETLIVIIEDVTERKRAELLLRSERDKFQGVLYAIGEGMYIVDSEYRIEYQNEICDRSAPGGIGKTCYQSYMNATTPCDFCLVGSVITSRETRHMEATKQDGRQYEMVFSPFVDADETVKVIVLQRDITEQKKMQMEAMRISHLASLGELSAGVAHEINNPINGIINYAQILRDQCDEESESAEIPKRIIKEGERIAQIVSKLLSFASDKREAHEPTDVKSVLSDALDLMRRQLDKEGIRLFLEMPEVLPLVRARPQEIQQVFLNLLSNARYALNRKYPDPDTGKRLQIRGGTAMVEGRENLCIHFRDQGSGIPEEIIGKICNPFFSTKPRGEGTGLGLSISHGIIKRHSGRLRFESTPGEYTEAIVELPLDALKHQGEA